VTRARRELTRPAHRCRPGYCTLQFATSLGTPLSERNCLRDLKLAARAAGVPDAICPHDLRRMTASLLVAEGVDLATAAAIMGHKNASVLLDVYAQALEAPKRAAARRLEGALYGVAGGESGGTLAAG
jgi:integrase